MPTQLEDVSNTVSQEKISNSRLRNEEIRRQMENPWTATTETSTTGATPTTLKNIYTNAGQTPTQASTYSSLLNNYKALGLDNGTDTNNNSLSSDGKSWTTQGWLAPATGVATNLLGGGAYSGLGSAAVNFAQGNKVAGTGNLASTLTSLVNKGSVPGLSGVVGTLASGLMGDKSAGEIGQGLVNSGIGTALSLANPIAGAAYSLARIFGFNPAYGLNNLFGNGMAGVAPGYGGTGGGFFGNNALGSGITSTMSNTPTGLNSAGYTPAGYTSGTLGTGITTNAST